MKRKSLQTCLPVKTENPTQESVFSPRDPGRQRGFFFGCGGIGGRDAKPPS
ncbi:hypothetical protein CKA32_001944 [Geitlerinema sp. FC II]|nr:hypothetical protein CKA32_001944 [Geitlerinema sp. FC II]